MQTSASDRYRYQQILPRLTCSNQILVYVVSSFPRCNRRSFQMSEYRHPRHTLWPRFKYSYMAMSGWLSTCQPKTIFESSRPDIPPVIRAICFIFDIQSKSPSFKRCFREPEVAGSAMNSLKYWRRILSRSKSPVFKFCLLGNTLAAKKFYLATQI